MSILTLYFLFVLLPNLAHACGALCFLAGIAFVITTIVYVVARCCDDKDAKNAQIAMKPISNYSMLAFLIFLLVNSASPDKDQIMMVAGAYAVTNSQDLKTLPDNLAKAANAFLGKLTEAEKAKTDKKD